MILKRFKKVCRLILSLLQLLGVLLATGTGFGSLLFGVPFMSQTFAYFDLPIFGKTELNDSNDF